MSIQAICAATDPKLQEQANRIAPALGMNMHFTESASDLEKCLAETDAAIVLCDLAMDPDALSVMARRHPQAAWIARIREQTGWPAAGELCRSCGFWEIIPGGGSATNLFEALREAAESGPGTQDAEPFGSTARHALWYWHQTALSQDLQHISPIIEKNSKGYLSQTHFLEIFYEIHRKHASGTLHLYRPGMHWVLKMNGGFPLSLDTRDSSDVFGFEIWYKHHDDGTRIDDLLPSARRRMPGSPVSQQTHRIFERRRSWLTALIAEIFTWPEAEFIWIPGPEQNLTADDPVFSTHDIEEISKDAAFERIPGAKILEGTQSCLSYFLKLKDNADGMFQSELSKKARIVADKLRNGSTLTEMLAALPPEYPVQRVVYLAVMTDELEWIS